MEKWIDFSIDVFAAIGHPYMPKQKKVIKSHAYYININTQ